MLEIVTAGLTLLWDPSRAWIRLRSLACDTGNILGYVAILAVLPFICRMAGHFLGDYPVGTAIAEALLFVLLVVGAAAGAGVLIWVAARRMGREIQEIDAQEIALFSATPFFVTGPLYAIPAAALHSYVLLASLTWGAFILFRGLWTLCGFDPRTLTVVALTGASVWILGSAVLSQVLFLLLVPR